MSEIKKVSVVFKVFRFNPDNDVLPYYKTYELEVTQEDVVLDVLNKIKWEHSGSLSYRRSCRHGICGSCAIKVNGKATLACKDNVLELANIFGEELVLEPQNQKRAYKDMVIDKSDFWDKYDAIKPYLIDDIDENPETGEELPEKEIIDRKRERKMELWQKEYERIRMYLEYLSLEKTE